LEVKAEQVWREEGKGRATRVTSGDSPFFEPFPSSSTSLSTRISRESHLQDRSLIYQQIHHKNLLRQTNNKGRSVKHSGTSFTDSTCSARTSFSLFSPPTSSPLTPPPNPHSFQRSFAHHGCSPDPYHLHHPLHSPRLPLPLLVRDGELKLNSSLSFSSLSNFSTQLGSPPSFFYFVITPSPSQEASPDFERTTSPRAFGWTRKLEREEGDRRL